MISSFTALRAPPLITVSSLITYPLKSSRGIPAQDATVSPIGLAGDRRLVVVEPNGRFVTARQFGELLRVSCVPTDSGWRLQHPEAADQADIAVAELSTELAGELWKDSINALDGGEAAAAWISEVLGAKLRVAVWQEAARFAGKYQFHTSFSDASPVLMATESSVRQACEWAQIESDVRRFRPNILLSGDLEPFVEDGWKAIQIGDAQFEVLDTCTRCILTTRDPDTGAAHAEKQPMMALKQRHPNSEGQPIFGMNVTLRRDSGAVQIRVGDRVEVR